MNQKIINTLTSNIQNNLCNALELKKSSYTHLTGILNKINACQSASFDISFLTVEEQLTQFRNATKEVQFWARCSGEMKKFLKENDYE